MSPELFYSLSCVRGFNNLNGKSYIDHILIIFAEDLSDQIKEKIKNSNDDKEALEYIPFEITHNQEYYYN